MQIGTCRHFVMSPGWCEHVVEHGVVVGSIELCNVLSLHLQLFVSDNWGEMWNFITGNVLLVEL